jgi:hypothetical protein
MLLAMGILVKYKQMNEKIRGMEPDEASKNLVENQELVLRRSSESRLRSEAGQIVDPEKKRYRPAG